MKRGEGKQGTHVGASIYLRDRVRIRGLVAAACFADMGHKVSAWTTMKPR
jgi:hypothetical protein